MLAFALLADLDIQVLDLLIQGGERDVEAFGGFGLAPTAFLEAALDDAAFVVVDDFEERGVLGERGAIAAVQADAVGLEESVGEYLDGDAWGGGQDDGPLDDVFQFTDVAGPTVLLQDLAFGDGDECELDPIDGTQIDRYLPQRRLYSLPTGSDPYPGEPYNRIRGGIELDLSGTEIPRSKQSFFGAMVWTALSSPFASPCSVTTDGRHASLSTAVSPECTRASGTAPETPQTPQEKHLGRDKRPGVACRRQFPLIDENPPQPLTVPDFTRTSRREATSRMSC